MIQETKPTTVLKFIKPNLCYIYTYNDGPILWNLLPHETNMALISVKTFKESISLFLTNQNIQTIYKIYFKSSI